MKLKIQDLYNVSYLGLGVVDKDGKLHSVYVDKKNFISGIASTLRVSRDLYDLSKDPEHENFERFYRQKYGQIDKFYNDIIPNSNVSSLIDLQGFKSFTDKLPNLEIDLDKNPKLFMWAFRFVCNSVPVSSAENEKFAFFSKLFPKGGVDKALKNYLEDVLASGYYTGGENQDEVNSDFPETRGLETFDSMKTPLIKAFSAMEKERTTIDEKLKVLKMGMSVHGMGNLNKVAWSCATRAFDIVLEDTKSFEKAKEYVLQERSANPNFYKSYYTEMKRWINNKTKELDLADKSSQDEIYRNKEIPNGVGSKIYQKVFFDTDFKEKIGLSATRADQVFNSFGHFFSNFVKSVNPDYEVQLNNFNYPEIALPSIEALIEMKPKIDQVLADMETVVIPLYEKVLKENKSSKFPNNSNGSKLLAEEVFTHYQNYMEEKNSYFLNIELNKNMEKVSKGSELNNSSDYDDNLPVQVRI